MGTTRKLRIINNEKILKKEAENGTSQNNLHQWEWDFLPVTRTGREYINMWKSVSEKTVLF